MKIEDYWDKATCRQKGWLIGIVINDLPLSVYTRSQTEILKMEWAQLPPDLQTVLSENWEESST